MKRLMILVLLLSFWAKPIFANTCYEATNEQLKNIFYAGVLKIINQRPEDISDRPEIEQNKPVPRPFGIIYTIQPIQSYISEEKTKTFEVLYPVTIRPQPPLQKPFLDVIFSSNNSLYSRYSSCGSGYLFKRYGWKEPQKISQAFLKEKKICTDEGKELVFITGNGYCTKKSEDYQKSCIKNSDCDGICIANLTPEELNELDRYRVKIKSSENSKYSNPLEKYKKENPPIYLYEATGHCSKWDKMEGCNFTIGHEYQNQKAIMRECF